MFINSQNFDDVKKYFQHTYVKFAETGDHIWHIDTVNPNEIICSDKNKEQVGIDLTIGYNLEYILPRKAVFQFGNEAVMLSRIPARQWKKGMCKANTAFHSMTSEGTWVQLNFDINMIEGFVNKPSYYPLDIAVKELSDENGDLFSVALNSRMSLSKSGKLYIDNVLVGKVIFKDKVVVCKHIFKPEIAKIFANGFTVKTV